MGCGESLVKFILFSFNFVFFLAGAGLLALGILAQLQVTQVTDVISAAGFSVAPITTIVVGAILFAIAFFGCCGACQENTCMLKTYAWSLIVLAIVKVVIGILVFVNLSSIQDVVTDFINQTFNSNTQDAEVAFGEMQSFFECCGTTGPSSYNNTIPNTCCASGITTCTTANAFQEGCISVVAQVMETYSVWIGGVLFGVAVVEIIGNVFALYLAKHISNKKFRV